jgi:precorrin-2/cobalt-factor-2 C20-methyltransferase
MQKVLTGIGLGPGDPELITIKGVKALQKADVIFYPATNVISGQAQSFSLKILQQLEFQTECRPLIIPMSGKDRNVHYRAAYNEVKAEIEKGQNVVVVNEGDVLFYSTFGYLLQMAQTDGITCRVIPGIPAFIAAGATGCKPVVDGDSGFNLIARPHSFDQVETALQDNPQNTLVVMKMKVLDGWYEFLKAVDRMFLYAEKVGTTEEFITSDAEALKNREMPYFSTIIFYEKVEG